MNYDAIVIGGGHNGLIAGCYLARGGQKVAVVEAAPEVGGMTSSGALISAAPNHIINPCAIELVFIRATGILDELGLDRHGFRCTEVDPPFVYLHEDGASLALWRDPHRTAEEIRRFSPADAASYLRFVDMLDKLADIALPFLMSHPGRPSARTISRVLRAGVRGRRILSDAIPLATASAAQVVDEWFQHPLVKDALIAIPSTAISPLQDTGAVLLLFSAFFQRFGVARPIGGMQALPAALTRCLQQLGGTIHTGRTVEEIMLTDGRASGVRFSDGTEMTATRAVIATCDPQSALGAMLPEGTLDRSHAARVAHMPTNRDDGAWMKVDVALSGQLRLERHQRWRTDDLDLRRPSCVIGGLDDGQRSWDSVRAGALPPAIGMYAVVPTAVDPTQAPAGQDALYLWGSPVPARPSEPWSSLADQASKSMVARASQYYDGIADLEIGRWVETPVDAAERLRAPGGSFNKVDFGLFRMGPLRPAVGLGGYTTPVPGLFLGGAGSHPGPGVFGLPGKLAAAAVLRNR